MTDKTEMVLVSRDELQQLIGASVRCAFEEYRQEQAPQDTSEYYTIRQLAEKWGMSIATIWRHEKLGHIKGQRIGRRVLFPKEQIDRIKSLKATNRKADNAILIPDSRSKVVTPKPHVREKWQRCSLRHGYAMRRTT